MQCTIERNSTGMNKFWPKYTLKLSYGSSQGEQMMLVASKLAKSKTPHYRIEIQSESNKFSKNANDGYLGRLRSNIKGNMYFIFDNGCKPEEQKKFPSENLRRQLGSILYDSDSFKNKDQRQIKVYLPLISKDKCPKNVASWPDTEMKKQSIDFEYQQQKIHKINRRAFTPEEEANQIMYFQSNPGTTMDFGGRVSAPSKKNFQITDDFDKKKIYIQFGRAGKQSFNMDVSYPFSVFQAFAICLSTFDYKI